MARTRPRILPGKYQPGTGFIYSGSVNAVEIKPNQVRLGEHCDYGTITLLFQLDSEGLQVRFLMIPLLAAS